jgi:hypothetical protein
VDAHGRRVGVGSDLEAGGDHDLVVVGEGVDVLDARDALDDRLQRLADQFNGVGARRPGAATMMSTIGTLIWGSSSLGIDTSASRPTAMAASRNSGVSGELIVARVSRPERPRFIGPVRQG